MGDINKRYVIGVGADKKSLEQLKADLNNTIKDAFNKIGKDGQVHGLSRADKAAIKADLSSVFDISSEQAEALRKMVQGIIPKDTKAIAEMRNQLEDTLKFATGIMEQMKQLGASTDWMKQGVTFVDKFSNLQGALSGTQQVVADIQTTVDALTKSFGEFKNALAVTNPDAFAKRFGQAAKSGTHVDANIKAIAKEMTDAAERASLKIQDVISELEDEGIKIAVTLQDPDAAEFTSQINSFVKKASAQFQKNPIKLDVELLDPFKNGAGAKLTKHQKKLADQAKEVAKSSGFSDESLIGLDSPDTSRTIRHIIESFQNIKKAVDAGQQDITSATKKWRQDINQELTLKAKFDNLDIKAEAAKLMHELQAFLNENPPLFIDVDIDNFVESLQEALRETVLTVNVKADNIDGKGATLNLSGAQLASGDKIEPVRNDPQATRPPQSAIPSINATKENSEVIGESTRVQNVLKDAVQQLNKSIIANKNRNDIVEETNTQRAEEAKKNAEQIAEYSDKIAKAREDIDSAAEIRRAAREKIPDLEQKRADALRTYAGRVKSFNDAVKNNDNEYIQKEFDWAVQYLNREKQETVEHIDEIRSRVDDANKDKKIQYFKRVSDDIDSLLKNKENQEDFILNVLQRSYHTERDEIEGTIGGLTRTIDWQSKRIVGINENIDYYNREIEHLSKENEITRSQKGIQSRKSQSKNQQQRLDNIQSVLDSNQSPVQLVFNELQEFWKKSYNTIEKTKNELDELKNGNYSDDLKAKLSKLTEDEQTAMIQGLIGKKEKRITDWTTRQSLMSQKGLGEWSDGAKLEDVLKSFTVESLTDVLSKSSTLSDDLLSNSSLKSLSSIKELAYYANIAQDALGFKVQTDKEYVDEATLQARLMELARIKTFTDKVQGMFPKNSGTPELQGIEAFIEFFEKLVAAKADISTIVSQAQGKIDTIQENLIQKSIERRMLGEPENPIEYENAQRDIARLQNIIDSPINITDAAKEYLESFKKFASITDGDTRFAPREDGKTLSTSQIAQVIWDGMDATVKESVTKAMLSSSEFAGVKELNQVSIAGVLDKMTKVFETGALKDITSEDKSYQQLVALLDRQSKFQRAKTVTDLQYSGSVKSSLYDARTPDKPIYVKVVGSHGEETTYDVHKPGKGRADSDRSFSTNPKGLERLFKHLGITEQVDQIVEAMFNDPALAQTLTDQLFAGKNISLSTKPFTRTASKSYSYADTPLAQYRQNKDKYDAQAKELESDIAKLQSGQYSESLLKQIEESRVHARQELQKQGKSESDIDAHLESSMSTENVIKKIIESKQKQLTVIQQLKPTEEQITESLIALMNDIEIGKAQEKDAKRSARRNANRAANLTDADSPDWAYQTRQNTERTAAKRAADMIRSGTKGSSQSLESPLQQIIDSVKVASQYGLMDTKEIEQLLTQYDEAYNVARNMPRIKDASTPVSMFDDINDAWEEEEELRNQVFDAFFGSDGWYAVQVVTDQMSVIEGELARKEQSITSSASSANSAIDTQIADINAREAKAKQDADVYATKLYDKYLREPEEEIQAELRRRSVEIEAKAKQTQDAKNNLGSLADRDAGLKQLKTDLFNQMQQDAKYIEANQLRRQSTVGSPKHQRYTQEIEEIENKYTAEYNKARQAWIDVKATELDAEYEAFVQSVKDSAVGDSSKNAVAKFNKDFKGKTTSKRKISGIQKFIEAEKKRMYQEAEAATQQAMATLDMSGTVSQETINKGIEKARKNAEKKRKAVLKSVKKKSDAELMAEGSYGQAATTASAEVERLKKQNADNEKLLKDLMAQYGRTKEMLNAERGIYESSQATQTAMQQQLGDDDSRMPGGAGGGYLGTIDTSNLATESTLRGIYELLNGAPPAGGWGDTKSTDTSDYSDNESDEIASSAEKFANSLNEIIKSANTRKTEMAALIGESGQLGARVQGTKSGVNAKDISRALAQQVKEQVLAVLHNHPSGSATLSSKDLQAAYNRAYSKGTYRNNAPVKVSGSIANGKITAVDFTDIDESTARKIVDTYKQKRDELVDATEEDIYKTLTSVFEQFGHIDAVQQIDSTKIEELRNNLIQNAQKQVAEISSVIMMPDGDITDKTAALLSKEINASRGQQDGGSQIASALSSLSQLGFTKDDYTFKSDDSAKLAKAYSQLQNGMSRAIKDKLHENVKDYIKVLQNKLEEIAKANNLDYAEINKSVNVQDVDTPKVKVSKKKNKKSTSVDNVVQTPSTTTSNNVDSSSGNTQGGLIGILSRIATEDTLSSIAALLAKGVKTTSGEKGSSSKKKSEDGSTLSQSDAESKLREYLNKHYEGAGYVAGAVNSTPTGYSINASRQKDNTDAIKEAQEAIAKCEVGTDAWWEATKRLTLLQSEQENIIVRINAETGKITASSSFKNLAVGAKAATKELQNIDDIMYRLHSSGALSFGDDGSVTSSNASVQKFLSSISALNAFTAGKSQEELLDPSNNATLSSLALAVQTYRKEIVALLNAVDQYNGGESKGILSGVLGNDSEIKSAMQSAISASTGLETSFGNLTPVYKNNQIVAYQLAYTMKIGKKEVQDMTASLNPLTHELTIQKGAVREVETGWGKFFSGLKSKWASIVQYMASITSITDMIRYVRTGVQYVREIDSALTELKKVTDETDLSYRNFLQDMSKTGGVVGSTVKDLTTMAAEWARLGYSMQEAGKLAKSTAILLNVSEFNDATAASEALISTMQAFKYTADESGHVVDILNEIGNNYAVSSDGIATALQDSASALMEGGNNLEQAVALVAAANRVVQDPNSVGSALRTISLRLRGTSVKILEEMGEETEGVVESTSKLQEKIKALSGVNILTDAGDYKDTYTILKEIGTVWEDMSDIDQAALLELMAGEILARCA